MTEIIAEFHERVDSILFTQFNVYCHNYSIHFWKFLIAVELFVDWIRVILIWSNFSAYCLHIFGRIKFNNVQFMILRTIYLRIIHHYRFEFVKKTRKLDSLAWPCMSISWDETANAWSSVFRLVSNNHTILTSSSSTLELILIVGCAAITKNAWRPDEFIKIVWHTNDRNFVAL